MSGPLSTSAFAAAIAGCETPESAFALLDSFVEKCGARYAVLYSFDHGVQSAADRWSPIYSTFPSDIADYYKTNRCITTDSFIRTALRSPTPVRFLEVVEKFETCEIASGLHAVMSAHGLRDGLAMHVSQRIGKMMYFNLSYDHTLEDMSEFERRRIQACIDMFACHCDDLLYQHPSRALSPKEREVVACLARGDSNKQIARALGVSLSTVNTLMKRSFKKLDAKTRVEAAIAASRTGLALVA
ncbi:LuxR C-terminal-related transcriptional regulator [Hyphococcus sp.]|uniref:LuxR C-terminal-related transcriptional regulator n=1 Tax=Hyphococcus sp. TaxID=2038636 RepID=UPI00208177D5|nr:MAG: hypothetical protein DHS20C04_25520 [Marinicaulis sp.]